MHLSALLQQCTLMLCSFGLASLSCGSMPCLQMYGCVFSLTVSQSDGGAVSLFLSLIVCVSADVLICR